MTAPGQTSPSPEARLVLALCRTPVSTRAQARIRALLDSPLHWDVVLGLAARWEVEPVALTNLLALAGDRLPKAVADEATLRRWAARASSWKMTTLFLDVLRAVDGAGIPSMVLKGPGVALLGYGDVTLRTFADLDLLVRPSDAPAVRELLVSRGFTPAYRADAEPVLIRAGHALELSDRQTQVEIHTALVSRHLNVDLPAAALWEESHMMPCLDSSIRVPALHHLYVYLCMHGAKHRWKLPRWACDVAQIDATVGLAEAVAIVRLAERTHTRRLVALGARLASALTDGERMNVSPDALAPAATTHALVAEAQASWYGGPERPGTNALSILHPALPSVRYWMTGRERLVDRLATPLLLALGTAPEDASAGSLRVLRRPLRLGTALARRVGWGTR